MTDAGASDAADDVVAQLERLERAGRDGDVVLPDGVRLHVSSLDRVYFPKAGRTKGDLLRYYARVAPVLLPLVADRPLVLRRFPKGVDGPSFFQQKAPEPPRRPLVRTSGESFGVDLGQESRMHGMNRTAAIIPCIRLILSGKARSRSRRAGRERRSMEAQRRSTSVKQIRRATGVRCGRGAHGRPRRAAGARRPRPASTRRAARGARGCAGRARRR